MEKLTFAGPAGKSNRRLSTLALANLIMMAGASKAADTATTSDNSAPTPATPAKKSTPTPAPASKAAK